ncbi:glycine reductase complex selenoprotein A [Marinisporobacter balticus]|nr:glycine reductase complex selenoprotein A [Marinisporobacter balticus]
MTEKYGAENVIVLFGAAEAESAGLAAETVTNGDPTFAGSLAGVQLGLKTYHAVEPEFKEAVDADVYEEQIGMMEMVLDVDAIIEEMSSMREQFCKF